MPINTLWAALCTSWVYQQGSTRLLSQSQLISLANSMPMSGSGGLTQCVMMAQVAFTTDPRKSRSSPYCTDVAKALNAPILHVNGDDVEAVTRAHELASEWRQRWHSDIVIDLVCYRKYGHNEIDEPSFTQPLMYQVQLILCGVAAWSQAHQPSAVPRTATGLGCLRHSLEGLQT